MPDYLVTDPATGQRIKMTGPAPPSEALIRLALSKVGPMASDRSKPSALKDEQSFQQWYAGMAQQHDLNPDPDSAEQHYDYRAAFRAGAQPNETGHWPSQFKREGHENLVVGGYDTRTGKRVAGTPRINDVEELVKRGWAREDAQQLVQQPEPGSMMPSHAPTRLQTADPLQAMQKAQTIGPARVGERYLEPLNPSAVDVVRSTMGGAARPASVAAQDPYGIEAWQKGAGPLPPFLMGSINPEEYRGQHTSPDPKSGAPLHDLTGAGRIYPDDVYGPSGQQYYGTRSGLDSPVFALAQRVKGKPDATVTVYRAVPNDAADAKILPGDWVTPSKGYAMNHGQAWLKNDYRILKKNVKASEVFTNGDSILEFGYHPADSPKDSK